MTGPPRPPSPLDTASASGSKESASPSDGGRRPPSRRVGALTAAAAGLAGLAVALAAWALAPGTIASANPELPPGPSERYAKAVVAPLERLGKSLQTMRQAVSAVAEPDDLEALVATADREGRALEGLRTRVERLPAGEIDAPAQAGLEEALEEYDGMLFGLAGLDLGDPAGARDELAAIQWDGRGARGALEAFADRVDVKAAASLRVPALGPVERALEVAAESYEAAYREQPFYEEPGYQDPVAPYPGVSAVEFSPEEVILRHWQAIAAGDYATAFSLFVPSYRSSNPSWIDDKLATLPNVDLASLGVYPTGQSGSSATLSLDLVAADTAGADAGICRNFVGEVTLRLLDGAWRYEPGRTLGSVSIDPTEDRCLRVTY